MQRLYFGCPVSDHANHGLLMCVVPHVLELNAWLHGTGHAMLFAVLLLEGT